MEALLTLNRADSSSNGLMGNPCPSVHPRHRRPCTTLISPSTHSRGHQYPYRSGGHQRRQGRARQFKVAATCRRQCGQCRSSSSRIRAESRAHRVGDHQTGYKRRARSRSRRSGGRRQCHSLHRCRSRRRIRTSRARSFSRLENTICRIIPSSKTAAGRGLCGDATVTEVRGRRIREY